jgi:hypothetical protein
VSKFTDNASHLAIMPAMYINRERLLDEKLHDAMELIQVMGLPQRISHFSGRSLVI